MAYGFGGDYKQLAEIMHRVRWAEEMPEKFEDYKWTLLIESVVDALNRLDGLMH